MKKVYESPITELLGCNSKQFFLASEPNILDPNDWEANKATFEEEEEDDTDDDLWNTNLNGNIALWD